MIQTAICNVLVGREPQLSDLEDALLSAHRGDGSVMLLSGEAGMGKSRLATELRRRADKLGVIVLEGACSEAELSLPYLPFVEALGNHLAETDVVALRTRLGSATLELAQLFPQLGDRAHAGPGDADSGRQRLFEAMLSLLRDLANDAGILLILEDLHWADASTRELLDYITRRIRASRLMILATYRSDEMHRKHPLLPTLHAWRRSGLARSVELTPMGPDAVGRMVSAIFDGTEVGAEFREFMHTRSEGNPFVLEEMLKAALDRGDIYRDESEWQRKEIKELRIPATVRDTIMLRVERMSEGAVDVLRSASVLGQVFQHEVLAEVAGVGERELEDTLESLTQEQLVVEDSGRAGRYRFRHALTQEAVYESMSAPRRERLHARAAEVLRARDGSAASDVAHHLLRSNHPSDALPFLTQASEEAMARCAAQEAAALLLSASRLAADAAERGLLICRAAESFFWASQPATAINLFEEGIALLEQHHRRREAAGFRLVLGRCRWATGHGDDALKEYEQAIAELEQHGPSPELAHAYVRMAGLLMTRLEPDRAIEFADRALQVADEAGALEFRISALNYKGCSLAYMGEHQRGWERINEAYLLAKEHGLSYLKAHALFNQSPQLWWLLRAEEDLRNAQELRQPPGVWSEAAVMGHELLAMSFLGRSQSAAELGRRTLEQAQLLEDEWSAEVVEMGLAWALIEIGELAEAQALIRQPLEYDDPQAAESIAWFWMRIHLLRDEAAEALRYADMVLQHPQWLRADPGLQVTTVEALLRNGRRDEANRLGADLLRTGQAPGPWAKLIGAHLALANDDAVGAGGLAAAARDEFEPAGYVPDEISSRVLLARCLAKQERRAEAFTELRTASTKAVESSARARLHEVLQVAAALGLDIDEAALQGAEAVATNGADAEHTAEVVATGERFVTVLFADVRNYTAMTAQTAPAEMVDRIATLHRWAQQEVGRERGVIDKFAGDAVMATFNVSGIEVDHCLHALRAATAIRDKAALNDTPIGVGIAVGPAVVGRLGGSGNLTVLGETTNLAARLQAAAEPGEILVSEEAYRRVEASLVGRGLAAEPAELVLKGFAAPVRAWRLRALAGIQS